MHSGLEQIKVYLSVLMDTMRAAELVPTTLTWEVNGDVGYLHRTSHGKWSCDTFVVIEGKINVQVGLFVVCEMC